MITRYIPNILTLCNLLSGCIGIVAVSQGQLTVAAYLIWLAALLDFADGLVARALKAYSNIGADLDSLADVVSFGVLPSFIMYALLEKVVPVEILAYIGFTIALFSALRLAIFNVDTRQKDHFIGLPVPASALLISALPLSTPDFFQALVSNPAVLIGITLVDSYLLVASMPLMAFKFKNYTWQDNQIKYLFVIGALLLFILLQTVAIPIIIIAYIILSVVVNRTTKPANL